MKKIIVCMLAVLMALPSVAQEAVEQQSDSLVLSLAEAQQFAIEHNRSIQNASLSVKQAEAARWTTIATMLPQVNAKFDYSNLCGYEMILTDPLPPIPMPSTGTTSITASMTLSASQIVGSLVHNLSIDMSNIGLDKTEQTIHSSVTNVYVSILALDETLDLLRKNLVNLNDLYDMTLHSVDVGVAEQTDADQISVQVASMQSTINLNERRVEVLYNSMRLLLGEPVDTKIKLTQTLDEIINTETAMKLLSEELNLDDNYDYALAEKQMKLAQEQMTLAAMDYVPSVSAFYQYSAKDYFGEKEIMNMTPPNMVGVTVNIPIWSSGQRAAAVHEKKMAYRAAKNSLADTEDQLRMQDRQFRYDLVSAYDNYEIQKKNIHVTQKVFENISKKFEFGYASSLDVTNTSTNLINAQANYISALIDMVEAHIKLSDLLNK